MNDKEKSSVSKVLFNYHKIRIIRSIQREEKTIKEIAEQLNEKPSRLYYHVNQLEKLGFLQVVREEQVNNLIQKYYRANIPDIMDEYNLTGSEASENRELIIQQLHAFTEGAIERIHSDLINSIESPNSEATFLTAELTKKEWKEINENIRNLIKNRNKGDKDFEKLTANYIIMSYVE
ncbi:winged helix-turn-helix domain-containing protein [Niallia sp.]|uniref:winged helix-turn-helix domain-containing protein n=1 Tax=Niallia sp. TaxID=2837523 RepID=UPI002898898C|nr:winged helix-turn-helix domain-containing protein [Niallia sp.]